MSSILFIVPSLKQGGSRRSLTTLIKFMPLPEGSVIQVMSLEWPQPNDAYYEMLKQNLVLPSWNYKVCIKFIVLRKILNALHNYLRLDPWGWIYQKEAAYLQHKYHYDTVVGFEESIATIFASKFPTKRIAWLHCDYNLHLEYNGYLDERLLYNKFDKIICVSYAARKSFQEHYPELEGKLITIYNTLDVEGIFSASKLVVSDQFFQTDVFTLISVGRFLEVKQFHLIPMIISRMIQIKSDIKFHWYIIGGGDLHYTQDIIKSVETQHLQKYLTILGEKDNPYYYIAKSNLLVSTSRSESWSYVINEAKVLYVPVVTLECPSSVEVVDDRTGFITHLPDLPELLVKLIEDDNGIYSRMKRSVSSFQYDNNVIISKVYQLLFKTE